MSPKKTSKEMFAVKKQWKEKFNQYKKEVIDFGGFIQYKVKNFEHEYKYYKKTLLSKEHVAQAARKIDMWDRHQRATGQPPLKSEVLSAGVTYVGDMDTGGIGIPPPQLTERKSGYKGPNAEPTNPPDLSWMDRLKDGGLTPSEQLAHNSWEELIKE
jgi:hypothetical protein